MSALLPNLVHFSRLLGSLGLDIQAVRTLAVVHALEHIDIGRRTDFYHALRSLLIHRPQDLALFDEAFRIFWRRPPEDWTTHDLHAMGEQRKTGAPQIEAPASPDSSQGGGATTSPVEVQQVATRSASDREVLQTKDFAQFTEDEVNEARRMMADLRWNVSVRRTRRWQVGHGRVSDLRRVVRVNASYGYELVDVPTRQRKHRRRPLVLLCDVSGSMERYSRMLLHFLACMSRRVDRVEVFLFATRLTRVTQYLNECSDLGKRSMAVPKLPSYVPDFAGGTRIGDTLATFNRIWAQRILGHGAVVLLISDGWDRGSPTVLGAEMARLQRTVRRLSWLNPLLGSSAYTPLTRGMQAALPFVDDFLPVHNLVSLQALAAHLNTLSPRSPRRGKHLERGQETIWTSPPPTRLTPLGRRSGIG